MSKDGTVAAATPLASRGERRRLNALVKTLPLCCQMLRLQRVIYPSSRGEIDLPKKQGTRELPREFLITFSFVAF
jgi:hypothetical protein